MHCSWFVASVCVLNPCVWSNYVKRRTTRYFSLLFSFVFSVWSGSMNLGMCVVCRSVACSCVHRMNDNVSNGKTGNQWLSYTVKFPLVTTIFEIKLVLNRNTFPFVLIVSNPLTDWIPIACLQRCNASDHSYDAEGESFVLLKGAYTWHMRNIVFEPIVVAKKRFGSRRELPSQRCQWRYGNWKVCAVVQAAF